MTSSPEHQTHTQRLQSQHLPDLAADYNFCVNLVEQQKFEESEPALRKLLVELEGRSNRREKGEFLMQEAGTLSLLEKVLEGLGREEEARETKERGLVRGEEGREMLEGK